MQFASINDRVKSIRNDTTEINRLVEEYKPFIAACVEKTTGKHVKYGEDDELSIAMLAFVEAIKSYNFFKGNFLSFSQNVIKRRLIDFYRKEKKHGNVVSLSDYIGDDESKERDLSEEKSVDLYSQEEISRYRRMEIEELKKELSAWDISLSELVDASPKHDKTRKMCVDIIRFILVQPELVTLIKNKKYLPVAEIEKNLQIPRKKIERMRKYLLAVIIIKTGDYQYISGYVNWGR
ncbi:MAG: RNA polymerase sigma-I factor [Clostridia bacterium]|nr:RNA polymerase sigma-I factor [Clostridia bacterium]